MKISEIIAIKKNYAIIKEIYIKALNYMRNAALFQIYSLFQINLFIWSHIKLVQYVM